MPRFTILPSKPQFFDLFERATENLVDAARALHHLLENSPEVEAQVSHITELEQEGDNIVHEVTDLIHTSLIAPLDHEDMQHLVSALDDALDAIEASAVRMRIFRVQHSTETARQLGEIIYRGAQCLDRAMRLLRQRKHFEQIQQEIIAVNQLENQGDALLYQGLELLVEHPEDTFNLVRWKEIYENLESATDRIEDVGDALQHVLIKNA